MADEAEVVDATSTDVVLYDAAMFPELRWADPLEVNARFAKRFEQAEDLDDLFAVLQGNSSQKMVGRKLQINAVDWIAYQADDGVIPNAICEAVDLDTGEVLEFATTSGFCTLFIRKAELLHLLPIKVKIVEKLTRSKQRALNFEPV